MWDDIFLFLFFEELFRVECRIEILPTIYCNTIEIAEFRYATMQVLKYL